MPSKVGGLCKPVFKLSSSGFRITPPFLRRFGPPREVSFGGAGNSQMGESTYYFVAFIDEFSRYIVHWELLDRMDGESVSIAAQAALSDVAQR